MTTKHVGIIALAALIFASLEIPANARGTGGSGMHAFHAIHFAKNFRHAHRRNFNNQWPWYGGYYEVPPYAYDNGGYAQPSNIVYVVAPAVRSCQYIKETVTVPAESGGTRDITVTRC